MSDFSDMQTYYERGLERDRLEFGAGRLEFERTIEIIQRTLPPAPAAIADIGGGPGRYTAWLIDSGYEVVHRDPVPLHVEQVKERHPGADSAIADARSLDLDDGSVDAVLLLGPLYHLSELDDRALALREALRVLRPGGVLLAAAISRWAPRLDGLLVNRVHLGMPQLLGLIDDVERSGVLPAPVEGGFCGFTHRPDELQSEIEGAGFEVSSLVSVEGIGSALPDLDERLDDPTERQVLLEALAATEAVPELLGLGPHLVATARSVG